MMTGIIARSGLLGAFGLVACALGAGPAPELIAPRDLAAHAGEGHMWDFALDASLNRIPERPGDPLGNQQEVLQYRRWIVVTGLLDHKTLRENYAKTLGVDLAEAHPDYRRVELERQSRLHSSTRWSQWFPVDRRKNEIILENIPIGEAERTPPEVRLEALVDILPYLVTGSWRGAHVEKLAAPEKGALRSPAPVRPVSGSLDFPKTEAPEVLLRVLDFTVEPDMSYCYRARIVVRDPNTDPDPYNRDRPDPAKDRVGPWSEPTEAVAIEWETRSPSSRLMVRRPR